MKSTPLWIRNRTSLAWTSGSALKLAAVETIDPISGYVSAWRMASM
jgi:hypothetical protein